MHSVGLSPCKWHVATIMAPHGVVSLPQTSSLLCTFASFVLPFSGCLIILLQSYRMWPFHIGFFPPSAMCLMFSHVFSWLHGSFPFRAARYPTVWTDRNVPVCLLRGISGAFELRQSGIKLPSAPGCRFLCGDTFSVRLGEY